MTADQLFTTILHTAYTRADLQRRIRLLREFLEKSFYSPEATDLTKFLLSKRATTDDIDAFLAWGDSFLDAFNKDNTYKLLNTMSEMIKSIPVISVYIPYEPVPAEVVKLGTWFRRSVGDNILLDIHTDPTLLGGCAFAWKGVYRDYSLRYYMHKRKEEISKIITDYVAKLYKD